MCGESLLPAIKVCIDWLQGDKPVVEACGKDSLDVLKKFVDLVNFINIDLKELEKGTGLLPATSISVTSLNPFVS